MAKYARGCASASSPTASSRPQDLHEAPAASIGRPRGWCTRRLRRRRRQRAPCRERSSGASAFPGRHRWSSARADRSARRLRPRTRRSTTASRRTWPAAPITRLPIAAKASACSTTSPSPRACCSAISIARRIAIVDLDVHQGNGTAAIFSGDASVFTFSMHGEKNFPFRKEVSDLDVALPDGTSDDEYLDAAATAPARRPEPPPAGLRLLSGGRRSVRRRSARAASS